MTIAMPHVSELTTNWWALALRGAVSILLGLVAFTMPGLTIAALVTLFGVYAFVQGILAIVAAIRGIKEHDRWGWMLLEGIVCIFAGVVALVVPSTGALALVWLVGAWAIAIGVLEIAAGMRLRRIMDGEWMLILAGVLAVLLGFYIVSRPAAGVLLLATWLGVYAIFAGIVTLLLAFRIRNWAHEHA